MKKHITSLVALMLFSAVAFAQKYEFRIITTVESIVPNGLGRSRMTSSNETRDYKEFTTSRSEKIILATHRTAPISALKHLMKPSC